MATSEKLAWGQLPLAVQSFSLEEFDVEDMVRHARELGFSRVELFNKHLNPRSTPAEIIRVKKLLNRAGLAVSAYGLFTFSRNHERNRTAFDFATLAGIRNIIGEVEQGGMESASALAEEYDRRVCIHTSGPNSRYARLENLVSALKGQHKNMGVCIDTGHILRAGGTPEEWIEQLAGRVFAVHLTDVAEKRDKTYNVVLGRGHLDLGKLLGALGKIGFPSDGSIALGFQANACARLMPPPENPRDALAALSQMSALLIH